MEVQKAYKLRIYPNKQQEQVLLQAIGACRFIYNYYLDLRINCYMQTGETIPYASMARDLTQLRNGNSYPWLKETNGEYLQQSLRALDTSYNRFFRKQSGFPRFKSRKDAKQSFRKHDYWTISNGQIHIQKGVCVKYRGTLPPKEAVTKTLTVSKTNTGKWYASIACIDAITLPTDHSSPIGIDLGLTHVAITSDGQKFDNLTTAKKQARHMKLLQQSLSRKQRGSNRREKAKLEIARLHEKIANRRMNYLHQVSSAITSKNHALIAVEDLGVANMLKNRHLSRSISDVSWHELIKYIEYKQRWRGGQFIKIDRFFPSSKICSSCLFVNQNMPLSVREWNCPKCSTHHDRDINAAKNILKQAEVQLGVESTESSGRKAARVTGSMKRGHAYA